MVELHLSKYQKLKKISIISALSQYQKIMKIKTKQIS